MCTGASTEFDRCKGERVADLKLMNVCFITQYISLITINAHVLATVLLQTNLKPAEVVLLTKLPTLVSG